MKFLTPMELRSVNFKKINQLYESKEIGFVGFNFDTFHTVWLPIQYEIGQKQIRMLDDGEITIEAKLVMALWQTDFSENLYLFSDLVEYIQKKRMDIMTLCQGSILRFAKNAEGNVASEQGATIRLKISQK